MGTEKGGKKSWRQKYDECNESGHQIKPVSKDMMGMKKGQVMLIATPRLLEDVIHDIPAGEIKDTPYLRGELAHRMDAEITCPVTTGIYLRILVEAAHERHEAGVPMDQIVPFWRVLGEKAPILKKVSFDLAPYMAEQEREAAA